MTRENKVGLAVCGSFLSLVAVVVVMKMRETPAADEPPPNSPPLAVRSEPSEGRHTPEAPPAPSTTVPEPVPGPSMGTFPPTEPPKRPHKPEPPAAPAPTLVLADPTPPSGIAPASAPADPPLPGPLPAPPPPPASANEPPLPPSAPLDPPPPLPPPSPPDGPGLVAPPTAGENKIKPTVQGADNVVQIPGTPAPPGMIDPPLPAPPGPVKVEDPLPLPPPVRIEPPTPSVVSPPGPLTVKIDPPVSPEPPPAAPTVIKIIPTAPPDRTAPPSTVIQIPAAALPAAPPPPSGPVIASTSPGAAPTRPIPTAAMPLVDSWDERTYVCKAGEDFASICKQEYHAEEYAAALQLYNRNHPRAGDALRRDGVIGAGDRIYLPPSGVLERRHSDIIPKPKPKPVAVGATTGEFGTVQAGFQTTTPAPKASPTYTVKAGGERLFGIAQAQLRNGDRWSELAKLNPDIVETNDPVPAGKVLHMPADFTPTPAVRVAPPVPAGSIPPPPGP